jgi:hypothetical protein
MRFVSRWGRFGVQIQPQIMVALGAGMAEERQAPLYAQFEPWKLLPHERQLALEHWTFNGLPQEQDEATMVPPDYRIGVFDTVQAQTDKQLTDEQREQLEQGLLEHASRWSDILLVPATTVPPPWPKYDEYRGSPQALVRKLRDEGHDLADVLEYERANQNRDVFVSALAEAIEGGDREEEIVA